MSKRFPVIGTKESIPWEVIEKHRKQAEYNHAQTLERLAERGGLSWYELHCALTNKALFEIKPVSDERSMNFVLEIVNANSGDVELKSCPFCGGEAEVYTEETTLLHIKYRAVHCVKCHGRSPAYQDVSNAIEAWNRRV